MAEAMVNTLSEASDVERARRGERRRARSAVRVRANARRGEQRRTRPTVRVRANVVRRGLRCALLPLRMRRVGGRARWRCAGGAAAVRQGTWANAFIRPEPPRQSACSWRRAQASSRLARKQASSLASARSQSLL
jgi:hypothetical protein